MYLYVSTLDIFYLMDIATARLSKAECNKLMKTFSLLQDFEVRVGRDVLTNAFLKASYSPTYALVIAHVVVALCNYSLLHSDKS